MSRSAADHSVVLARIKEIWEEALSVPCPLDSTFFAVGGHSLAAFRILAKIEAEYDVHLDVGSLFDDPILADFAASVSSVRDAAAAPNPLATADVDYWREIVNTPAAPLRLPYDAVPGSGAPGEVALPLPDAAHERLREIVHGTAADATPKAVLLAAFVIAITRSSGLPGPCTLADVDGRPVAVRPAAWTTLTPRDALAEVTGELAKVGELSGVSLPDVLAAVAEEEGVAIQAARIFPAGFAWRSGEQIERQLPESPLQLAAFAAEDLFEARLTAPGGTRLAVLDALAQTIAEALDELTAELEAATSVLAESPSVDGAVEASPRDEPIGIGERIDRLARAHPDAPAVLAVSPNGSTQTLTWGELERLSNAAARGLLERGVPEGGVVAIALHAGIGHVVATLAAWKLGALVVPLDPEATPAEQDAVTAALGDHTMIGYGPSATIPADWWTESQHDDVPPHLGGTPRSASMTGGTSGLPRVVVRRRPWTYSSDAPLSSGDAARGMRLGQVQLVVLPMYHAGFSALYQGLALDHQVVVMERFAPRLLLHLVQRHAVSYLRIVPTLMRLVLDVPDLDRYDLSSVEVVHHGAGPCPEHVKRSWLEMVGPERVIEDYASQERLGSVVIRGDEWLEHPGSVGRPAGDQVRILDDEGKDLPPGEVGAVYLRPDDSRQPTYIGEGPALPEREGYFSVGDLGYLDAGGYLFLVGRESNVLNVGGTNVYPAEVEAVLARHPEVADAAVIGRRHEYLGQGVHALVVPREPGRPVEQASLEEHCQEQLSRAKVPMSYEFVAAIPRKSSGKLRRADLPAAGRAAI